MARNEHLRRHHAELTALAQELVANLDDRKLTVGADETRRTLAAFKGLLGVHIAMEDNAVYPRLLAHHDAAIRDAAGRLQREFGGIFAFVDAYTNRWMVRGAIEKEPAVFATETRTVQDALGRRIEAEEQHLYGPLDAL